MRKTSLIRFAEKGFASFVLFFSTAPLIPLFRVVTEGSIIANGDPLIQPIWFVIYLINLFLIILRWRRFIYIVKKNKIFLLITGLAVVSALWSADSILTLRSSMTLLFTNIFAIYLTMRYSFKEQLQLLAWALGIAALLSLLFVIVPPYYGIEINETHAGAWRGIYHQKNALGRYMSLSAVVFLLLAFSSSRYVWLLWVGFGISSSLLMFSTAKSALVTFLTILVLLPICKALRWHYGLRIPFLIALVLISGVVVTFVFTDVGTVLGILGKDTTLTGRTQLWYLLLNMGTQHPWLGYGYNGFWLGWDGPSALIWSSLLWQPRHAHNGFIQLWLDLGLIGVLLFSLSFIQASLKAVAWVRSTKTLEGFWPLIFLAWMSLSNVSDSMLLASNNILWMLYVATSLSMVVQSERERKTSYISTTLNKKGLAQDA